VKGANALSEHELQDPRGEAQVPWGKLRDWRQPTR
jgi:hypothetical protein